MFSSTTLHVEEGELWAFQVLPFGWTAVVNSYSSAGHYRIGPLCCRCNSTSTQFVTFTVHFSNLVLLVKFVSIWQDSCDKIFNPPPSKLKAWWLLFIQQVVGWAGNRVRRAEGREWVKRSHQYTKRIDSLSPTNITCSSPVCSCNGWLLSPASSSPWDERLAIYYKEIFLEFEKIKSGKYSTFPSTLSSTPEQVTALVMLSEALATIIEIYNQFQKTI